MKEFLEEEMQKQIENKILEHFGEELSTFEKKFQIGENDSYICSLIRSDLVEEFVTYVNRTNLPLLSTINPSIYETNLYLVGKKPTLIRSIKCHHNEISNYIKDNLMESIQENDQTLFFDNFYGSILDSLNFH